MKILVLTDKPVSIYKQGNIDYNNLSFLAQKSQNMSQKHLCKLNASACIFVSHHI